ncbi:helix-turn-helix domain-containing protein [Sphingomonas sp. Leaf62]|uniref:helix-turn-helix domain-containing protein n=1 Tax=Sphingomonas sp. Leaf62 TaxID=1736228 RepID=UPI0006FD009D|nr:helix-turn-helix transcriptional regulator [Sphingomonas sp. Leaf62]KQN79958.1 hypothetical protein ASE91_11960 [Sphingomonas sp. Leaf62]
MTESEALARLTPRERRCLDLVAQHYDTGQIAAELGISVATVNGYLADARRKLGARNRKEAARMLGAAPVASREPPIADAPSEHGGMFERVAPVPPPPTLSAARVERGSAGWLSRLLYLERTTEPHRVGARGRTLMIVGLVVAMCAALAMAVVAAVGLVSIFASLRS